MVVEEKTKTVKWICPNCKRVRMMNRGVIIVLCENCQYRSMVLEGKREIKLKKDPERKQVPVVCTCCGKPTYVVGLIRNESGKIIAEVCYSCFTGGGNGKSSNTP